MANPSLAGLGFKVDLCCQGELKSNQDAAEKRHQKKGRIEEDIDDGLFEMMGRDGEHKGEEEGEEDDR